MRFLQTRALLGAVSPPAWYEEASFNNFGSLMPGPEDDEESSDEDSEPGSPSERRVGEEAARVAAEIDRRAQEELAAKEVASFAFDEEPPPSMFLLQLEQKADRTEVLRTSSEGVGSSVAIEARSMSL